LDGALPNHSRLLAASALKQNEVAGHAAEFANGIHTAPTKALRKVMAYHVASSPDGWDLLWGIVRGRDPDARAAAATTIHVAMAPDRWREVSVRLQEPAGSVESEVAVRCLIHCDDSSSKWKTLLTTVSAANRRMLIDALSRGGRSDTVAIFAHALSLRLSRGERDAILRHLERLPPSNLEWKRLEASAERFAPELLIHLRDVRERVGSTD